MYSGQLPRFRVLILATNAGESLTQVASLCFSKSITRISTQRIFNAIKKSP